MSVFTKIQSHIEYKKMEKLTQRRIVKGLNDELYGSNGTSNLKRSPFPSGSNNQKLSAKFNVFKK